MTPRHACFIAVVATVVCAAVGCTLVTSLDGLSDGSGGAVQDGPSPIDAGGDDAPSSVPDAPAGNDAAPVVGADGATVSRYAAAVLADAPLLYYRFGEKSGSPAKDEISGTTTPYSLTGLTYGIAGALAGDPDTAVTTDGSGTLQLTQSADFEGLMPYSVEAWVRTSPAAGAIGFVVDHESWSADRVGWLIEVGNSAVTFERYVPVPDAGSSPRAIGAGLGTGAWHYVVGTYDGATMRLYVDGVRSDTGGADLGLPKINVPYTVGKQNCTPCNGNGFVGTLDELAIYPKALAEDRILAHYAAAH